MGSRQGQDSPHATQSLCAIHGRYDNCYIAPETAYCQLAPVLSIPLFSMIARDDIRDQLLNLASKCCQVPCSDIEDIYPCTPMQENLMEISIQNPGTYVARYVYKIPDGVDLQRFCAAWDATVRAHNILRTRVIEKSSLGMFQVVMKTGIDLKPADSAQTYLESDLNERMGFGTPMIRVGISEVSGEAKDLWCVITIHHVLYDDWGLRVILDELERAYCGSILQPQPFNSFVQYALNTKTPEAEEFWRTELANINATSTPWAFPSAEYRPAATGLLERCMPLSHRIDNSLLSATVKAAWSIVLFQYTDSTEVLFGDASTGRNGMAGLDAMSGVMISTTPFRSRVSPSMTVKGLVDRICEQETRQMPYEQLGLRAISHLSEDTAAACHFGCLLVTQPQMSKSSRILHDVTRGQALENHATFGTYALTLVCDVGCESVQVQAVYDEHVIAPRLMDLVLDQFAHMLGNVTACPNSLVAELMEPGPANLAQLKLWNEKCPERLDTCVHTVIVSQCMIQPEAPALCTTSETLSYGELARLSSRLAAHLKELNVEPEQFIPLCFEKSKWTTIAMLAVMKSGAAFVLLDPSYPDHRLEEICKAVGATTILCSSRNAAKGKQWASQVVSVDGDEDIWSKHQTDRPTESTTVLPYCPLYAVFTSGSTGKPKGIVIQHDSFCTTAQAYLKVAGIDSRIRVLQFSSYAFDVSISDTLVTLMAGGCICLPSETERNSDLARSITQMGVNFADLTPSLLRSLSPSDAPTLETLVLGGEAMSKTIIEKWSGHVRLLNAYGPAECCMLSTLQDNVSPSDPANIGYATGGACWVVDKEDHDRLMPIGAVGELLIEGPVVGRAYINAPDQTLKSFIEDIAWLKSFRKSRSRVFKTGDLVRYNPDGSLVFLGRKDTQVKLCGQRIELAEVEHHVQSCFSSACNVIAEVVTPIEDGRPPFLVAFIHVPRKREGPEQSSIPSIKGSMTCKDDILAVPTEAFRSTIPAIEAHLCNTAPACMVPSVFLPLVTLPLTAVGKTDRRRLRDRAAALSQTEIELYSGPASAKRMPATAAEQLLHRQWAQVLSVPPDTIGIDDSFFHLGGDSIAAMQLSALLRQTGWLMSVGDLFHFKSIARLAPGPRATRI